MTFPVKPSSVIAARKQGFESSEILQEISKEDEAFQDVVERARIEGFNDDEILQQIQDNNTRGVALDVATQLSATSLGRGAIDFAHTVGNILEAKEGLHVIDIVNRITNNAITRRLGIAPDDIEIPERVSPLVVRPSMFQHIGAIINSIFPTREEYEELVHDYTGIDVKPQTPIGEDVASFLQGASQGLVFGPVGAVAVGTGQLVEKKLSDAGVDERDIRDARDLVEIGIFLSPKPTFNPQKFSQIRRQRGAVFPDEITRFDRDITSSEVNNFVRKNKPQKVNDPGLTIDVVGERIPVNEAAERIIDPVETSVINEQLKDSLTRDALDNVAPQQQSQATSLTQIRDKIVDNHNEYRNVRNANYQALNEATERAGGELVPAQLIIAESNNLRQAMREGAIPAQGRQQITTVMDAFEQQIVVESPPEPPFESVNPTLITGRPEQFTFERTVPDRFPITAIANYEQRLKDVIDFGFPDLEQRAKASRFLRNLITSVQISLEEGYSSLDRRLGFTEENGFVAQFNKAKQSHAQMAEIYGKDVVRKLINAENPLQLANRITDPSDFGFLKQAVREVLPSPYELGRLVNAPDQGLIADTLDRFLLEELNLKKATDKVKRDFVEFQHSLSQKASTAGEEIIHINDPFSIRFDEIVTQRKILDAVRESVLDGRVNDRIFDFMRTPEGLQRVREVMELTEDGLNALRQIEEAFVQSIHDSFITDGSIQFAGKRRGGKKTGVQAFLKNRPLMSVYESIQGREALNELRRLNATANRIQRVVDKNLPRDISTRVKRAKAKKTEALIENAAKKSKQSMAFGMAFLDLIGVPMKGLYKFTKLNVLFDPIKNTVQSQMARLLRNKNIRALIHSIEKADQASMARKILALGNAIKSELETSEE